MSKRVSCLIGSETNFVLEKKRQQSRDVSGSAAMPMEIPVLQETWDGTRIGMSAKWNGIILNVMVGVPGAGVVRGDRNDAGQGGW